MNATFPRNRISLLLDVDPSDIVDGVTLQWNATTEKWEAVIASGGGGGGGGFLPDYANAEFPDPAAWVSSGQTPVHADKWNLVIVKFSTASTWDAQQIVLNVPGFLAGVDTRWLGPSQVGGVSGLIPPGATYNVVPFDGLGFTLTEIDEIPAL